jgi:hypothetical protein
VSCLAEPRDILVCGPILDLRFSKPEGMLKYLRRSTQLFDAQQMTIRDVKSRIAALERVRDGLATLIEACPGRGRAAECPILQALNAEE